MSYVYTSSKALIIINSVVISDEIKAALQNKGTKEKMDMINASWKAWNKKWDIQDGNIDPHDWISKCKIQGYRVNGFLYENRKFYQDFGNNNGIPNKVIEAVNPKRILTEGVEIWGVKYINNKNDGIIEYYEIETISKVESKKKGAEDRMLDFVANNGIPFLNGDEAKNMKPVFTLLKEASVKIGNVYTIGGSVEARAGVAMASAGIVIASNYAADRYGNMAFVISGSFHASYYDGGWSFADAEAGAAHGGSWYFGADIGLSVDAAHRLDDRYAHVSDLSGFERSFDIDFTVIDISIIYNNYSQYSGVELSAGLGVGLGFGFLNTKSSVLAFSESDLVKMSNSIIEGENKLNNLESQTINPLFGYLTLKPKSNGYNLCYDITEFKTTPFSFLNGDNEIFKLIYSDIILEFEKPKNNKYEFYYKTNSVKDK